MLDTRGMLKGSVVLLGASVLARGSMLLFRYVAALTLSAEDYGRLSLYISLFLSMSTIASFGVGASLAKLAVRESRDEIETETLYGNCVLLTSATSLLASIMFALILKQSAYELLTYQVIAASCIGFLFWSYFQVSIGFSLAEMKFGTASLYEAGDGIVKLVLLAIAGLFVTQISLEAYIMAFSLGYVMLSGLALRINARTLGIGIRSNPLRSFDVALLKGIVSHSSALMVVTFINLFYGFIVRSFLAGFSNSEVAIFDMALTFYSIPKIVFVSLVRPVVPYASRRAGDKVTVPGVGKIVVVLAAAMAIAVALHYSGSVAALLHLLRLPGYIDSFPVFLVLMGGALFDLIFGFLSSYFQGIGKVNVICAITVCVFLLTLPISFYAVQMFRLYGAAAANVFFFALLASATAFYAHRRIGFQKV
jgi:O-antigen/teichoic acid export membrane protein